MRFFRFPKRDPRYAQDESPLQRFLRIVIIALLFCGVIWGFWMNSERQMNKLKKPPVKLPENTISFPGNRSISGKDVR